MKKIVLMLICVFFFGCATGQQPLPTSEGIVFETGKSRKVVMHAIIIFDHIDDCMHNHFPTLARFKNYAFRGGLRLLT